MKKGPVLLSMKFAELVTRNFDGRGQEDLEGTLKLFAQVLLSYAEVVRDSPEGRWIRPKERKAVVLGSLCLERIELYPPLIREAVRNGDASRSAVLALEAGSMLIFLERVTMRALSEYAFDSTRIHREGRRKGTESQQKKADNRALEFHRIEQRLSVEHPKLRDIRLWAEVVKLGPKKPDGSLYSPASIEKAVRHHRKKALEARRRRNIPPRP